MDFLMVFKFYVIIATIQKVSMDFVHIKVRSSKLDFYFKSDILILKFIERRTK